MNELHQKGEIVRDRYQVVSLLGQGSTGSTYKAIDLFHSQTIAIKVVSLYQVRDWKILELFEREAKVLASLEHPAIPKYLDYFYLDTPEDRRFYLIRELVEGNSLAVKIKAGWYPIEMETKDIAQQILKILTYLHGLEPPVIHRDIKPENIIYTADRKVFLVDFGGVQEVYRKTLSHSGTFVGTIGYMSPEQFRGKAIFASDLYALGMTLLYLLARHSPEDLPQMRMKIDFRSHVKISQKFANWLEKTIEPAIEDRFSSAGEALQELERDRIAKLSYEQPLYSRVNLHKTRDRLFVEIPPADIGVADGLRFLVTVVFIIMAIFMTLITIGYLFYLTGSDRSFHIIKDMSGVLFMILNTVNLWGFSLLCIFILKERIGDRVRIAIDRQSFQLRRQFFFLRHTIKGTTSDLEILKNRSKCQKITFSYTKTGIHNPDREADAQSFLDYSQQYEFGSWLRQAERDWLQAEIAEFLDRL
ncbi:MAG: serine/threonine-protein kinase [Cyanobacteria bacterium P01_E01_bin.42]